MKCTGTLKSTKGGKSAPATPSSPSSSQIAETSAGKRKRGRALNVQSRLDSLLESQRKLQARKNSKDNIFDEVEQGLQANRDRITPTTQAEEDDEITKQPRIYKCKSPSIIWSHVTRSENLVQCKHCEKKWNSLSGSTSNPLKHIRTSHYIKLSDEEKGLMSHNGETSGKSGVKKLSEGKYTMKVPCLEVIHLLRKLTES